LFQHLSNGFHGGSGWATHPHEMLANRQRVVDFATGGMPAANGATRNTIGAGDGFKVWSFAFAWHCDTSFQVSKFAGNQRVKL
jgi:hypothetical protein